MEITPPISPTRDLDDNDTINILHSRGRDRADLFGYIYDFLFFMYHMSLHLCSGGWGFHCAGEITKKATFDRQGFLLNGEGTLLKTMESNEDIRQPFFTVFNQLCDIDSSRPDEIFQLFQMARYFLSLSAPLIS